MQTLLPPPTSAAAATTTSGDNERRQPRFIFNANFTCGSIPFCDFNAFNGNLTVLADDPQCSKPRLIFSMYTDVALSTLITVGNLLILHSFFTSRNLRKTPQSIIKVSMSLFDLFVGVVVIPTSTYYKWKIYFRSVEPSPSVKEDLIKYFRDTQGTAKSCVFGAIF